MSGDSDRDLATRRALLELVRLRNPEFSLTGRTSPKQSPERNEKQEEDTTAATIDDVKSFLVSEAKRQALDLQSLRAEVKTEDGHPVDPTGYLEPRLRAEEDKVSELSDKLARAEAYVTDLQSDLKIALDERKDLASQLAGVREDLSVEQERGRDLEARQQSDETELQAARSQIASLQYNVTVAQEQLASHKRSEKDYSQNMQDLLVTAQKAELELRERIDKLTAENEALSSVNDPVSNSAQERIIDLEGELTKRDIDIVALNKQHEADTEWIKRLEDEIKAVNDKPDKGAKESDDAKQRILELESELKNAKQLLEDAQQALAHQEADTTQERTRAQVLRAEKSELAEQVRLLKRLSIGSHASTGSARGSFKASSPNTSLGSIPRTSPARLSLGGSGSPGARSGIQDPEFSRALEEEESRRQSLEAQVQYMKEQHAVFAGEIRALKGTWDDLHHSVGGLQMEGDDDNSFDMATMQTELLRKDFELDQTLDELAVAQETIQGLRERVLQQTDDNKDREAAIQSLTQQLNVSADEESHLRAQVQLVFEENASLKSQLAAMPRDVDAIVESHPVAIRTLNRLLTDVQHFEALLNNVKSAGSAPSSTDRSGKTIEDQKDRLNRIEREFVDRLANPLNAPASPASHGSTSDNLEDLLNEVSSHWANMSSTLSSRIGGMEDAYSQINRLQRDASKKVAELEQAEAKIRVLTNKVSSPARGDAQASNEIRRLRSQLDAQKSVNKAELDSQRILNKRMHDKLEQVIRADGAKAAELKQVQKEIGELQESAGSQDQLQQISTDLIQHLVSVAEPAVLQLDADNTYRSRVDQYRGQLVQVIDPDHAQVIDEHNAYFTQFHPLFVCIEAMVAELEAPALQVRVDELETELAQAAAELDEERKEGEQKFVRARAATVELEKQTAIELEKKDIDHGAEVESLTKTIAELKEQLAKAEDELESTRRIVDRLTKELEARRQVTAAKSVEEQLALDIAATEQRIADHEQAIVDHAEAEGKLRAKAELLASKAAEVEKKIKSREASHKTAKEECSKRENELTKLQETLRSTQSALEGLRESKKDFDSKLTDTKSTIRAINKESNGVKKDITRVEQEVDEAAKQVKAAQARAKQLTERQLTLDKRLADRKKAVQTHSDAAEKLAVAIEEGSAEEARLTANLADLRKQESQRAQTRNAIQQQLGHMRGEIAEVQALIEAQEARNSTEHLHAQQTALTDELSYLRGVLTPTRSAPKPAGTPATDVPRVDSHVSAPVAATGGAAGDHHAGNDTISTLTDEEGESVKFSIASSDGDHNYPGSVASSLPSRLDHDKEWQALQPDRQQMDIFHFMDLLMSKARSYLFSRHPQADPQLIRDVTDDFHATLEADNHKYGGKSVGMLKKRVVEFVNTFAAEHLHPPMSPSASPAQYKFKSGKTPPKRVSPFKRTGRTPPGKVLVHDEKRKLSPAKSPGKSLRQAAASTPAVPSPGPPLAGPSKSNTSGLGIDLAGQLAELTSLIETGVGSLAGQLESFETSPGQREPATGGSTRSSTTQRVVTRVSPPKTSTVTPSTEPKKTVVPRQARQSPFQRRAARGKGRR